MRSSHAILAAIGAALLPAAGLGACSPGGAPSLSLPAPQPGASPPITPTQIETGAVAPAAATPPVGTTVVAGGTPTEIYSRVAAGALRCWFGAGGPLKATHIFNAEAAPPSEGGAAEIVVHERDPTSRDPRGTRAFRVGFVGRGGSVEVAISPLKIAPPLSELMVRDVEAWVQGGSGCQLRALLPPAEASAPPDKSAGTKTTQSTRR
jgi:hypothetical protein